MDKRKIIAAASALALSMSVSASVSADNSTVLMGDVNGDSEFTVSDVIQFKKWLVKTPDIELVNWKAADFVRDNKLNAIDYTVMKNELLEELKDTEIIAPEPITSYNAPPISLESIADVTLAVNSYDLNEYPENFRQTYKQMFERFKSDGFIYYVRSNNTVGLVPGRVTLYPSADYEDIGVGYTVTFKDKRYTVIFYSADKDVKSGTNNIAEYVKKRSGRKSDTTMSVKNKEFSFVTYSTGQSYADAWVDDNHYLDIIGSNVTEEEIAELIDAFDYAKLDTETQLPEKTVSTYVYEKKGFGGLFTINIEKNGDFTYYEGDLSSIIGSGTWEKTGDTLVLTETGGVRKYCFKIEGNDLVFISEGSSKFTFTDVKDGEIFRIYDAASDMISQMAGITTFDMTSSKDGVEEFLKNSFVKTTNCTAETCFNVTPDEITEKYGFRVFKDNRSFESYIEYNGYVFHIGDGFGGAGITAFAIADMNLDGMNEVYYTFSWGSGLHHAQLGYFDLARSYETQFDYCCDKDMTFDVSNGRLELYNGSEAEPKEKIGEITFDMQKSKIRFVSTGQNTD